MNRSDADAVEGGEQRDSLNGLIEEELQRPTTIPPAKLERAIPVYEHLFVETRIVALGRHVKKICVRCGLESFQDVRALSARVKCVPRELLAEQVAEIEGKEEATPSAGALRVTAYLLLATAVVVVASVLYFLVRLRGH